MEKEKYSPYSQCCGRQMHYAPKPKCNYNSCCLNEYRYTMPACIRNKQPDCLAKAVIPSVTVETVDGITNLANCFVHVTGINTTFYIDDKHRPMIIWAGDVEIEIPEGTTEEEVMDMVRANERGLKSQHLLMRFIDNEAQKKSIGAVYYDKNGTPYNAGTYEEIGELI